MQLISPHTSAVDDSVFLESEERGLTNSAKKPNSKRKGVRTATKIARIMDKDQELDTATKDYNFEELLACDHDEDMEDEFE
jgi:hypothetical protein